MDNAGKHRRVESCSWNNKGFGISLVLAQVAFSYMYLHIHVQALEAVASCNVLWHIHVQALQISYTCMSKPSRLLLHVMFCCISMTKHWKWYLKWYIQHTWHFTCMSKPARLLLHLIFQYIWSWSHSTFDHIFFWNEFMWFECSSLCSYKQPTNL